MKSLPSIIFALLIVSVAVAQQVALPINANPSVTLAWDPVQNTTNSTIAHYSVYYGPASTLYTSFQPSRGTNTSLTISNLGRGSTYYFAATATDTNGLESDYSSEVSCTIPSPPPPPTVLRVITVN